MMDQAKILLMSLGGKKNALKMLIKQSSNFEPGVVQVLESYNNDLDDNKFITANITTITLENGKTKLLISIHSSEVVDGNIVSGPAIEKYSLQSLLKKVGENLLEIKPAKQLNDGGKQQ